MKYTLVVATITSLAGLVVLGACSDDPNAGESSSGSNGTTSSGGTATVPAAECKTRCAAKIEKCGAPAAQTEVKCTQFCGPGLTGDQLECVEKKSCAELDEVESADDVCPRQSSSGGTSGTSSGGTSGGSSGLPTSLTIEGRFGTGRTPSHTNAGGSVVSVLQVAATDPSIDPEPSTLPNLASKDISVSVASPDPGDCEATITFTLNGSEISMNVEGTDEGGARDCEDFTDAIAADGFEATLSNVPYPNGTTKATVLLDLKP